MSQPATTSTKQEALLYLMKQGSATAQELAKVLAISPQAMRRHLKDLESEGLLEFQSVHSGMGRPQNVYELTAQGRERFAKQYDQFAISFLDTLVQNLGYDQASQILHQHWQRKSQEYRERLGNGSLTERMSRLTALRRQEGYMTEFHPIEDTTESPGSRLRQRFVLTEHNCAIAQVAHSFPTVCGHELEMFETALADCRVERTHWIVDGEHRCGYVISAMPENPHSLESSAKNG
jgi:DeoR family transcriptional regulator, suf operon transcriptional repressor